MFLNLIAEIKKRGITQKEFAQRIKIDEIIFSKKINSKIDFKLNELIKIAEFFEYKLAFDYLFEEKF